MQAHSSKADMFSVLPFGRYLSAPLHNQPECRLARYAISVQGGRTIHRVCAFAGLPWHNGAVIAPHRATLTHKISCGAQLERGVAF